MSVSLEGLMTMGGDETRALAMVKVNHKIITTVIPVNLVQTVVELVIKVVKILQVSHHTALTVRTHLKMVTH